MRARCPACELTMDDGVACLLRAVEIDGRSYLRAPYLAGEDVWPSRRYHLPEHCHDCAVALGQLHHLGCDMEVCPSCGNQFMTCGCLETMPLAPLPPVAAGE
jgi:hypothetical protein